MGLLPRLGWVVAFSLFLAIPGTASAQGKMFDSLQKLFGSSGGGASGSALSESEIVAGLREALKVGTGRVVDRVGRTDGFNADPEIHIPLPDTLRTVQKGLRAIGAGSLADDVELRLNRAAEAATPRTKEIFWNAVTDMTIEDIQAIYKGPDDAATQYFRGKMSGPLADSMHPVVDSSLAEVGAIQAYDRMIGQYKTLPFVPDVKADLTTHVLDKALDAVFLYLAREEAAIRKDPLKRSTEILKKVFGAAIQ